MKLYIPALGDDLHLTADWAFRVYDEYRNSDVVSYFNLKNPHPWDYETRRAYDEWNEQNVVPVQRRDGGLQYTGGSCSYKKFAVIPAGTVLRVKRIYIRQGGEAFNSVTFLTKMPNKAGKGKDVSVRFWAKLEDCNNIEFAPVAVQD